MIKQNENMHDNEAVCCLEHHNTGSGWGTFVSDPTFPAAGVRRKNRASGAGFASPEGIAPQNAPYLSPSP